MNETHLERTKYSTYLRKDTIAVLKRYAGTYGIRVYEVVQQALDDFLNDEYDDVLDIYFKRAVMLLNGLDSITAAFVQRKLKIPYSRALRILDQLEKKGLLDMERLVSRGKY